MLNVGNFSFMYNIPSYTTLCFNSISNNIQLIDVGWYKHKKWKKYMEQQTT
jgi:hypothetical protein